MRQEGSFDLLKVPPRVCLANFYPFAPGQSEGPHWSESSLFLPVTHGCGNVQVGPQHFTLNSGQVLHVPWAAPIKYDADRHDPFVLIGIHLTYRPWLQKRLPFSHFSKNIDMKQQCMQTPPCPQPYAGPFILSPPPESKLIELATAITTAFDRSNQPGGGKDLHPSAGTIIRAGEIKTFVLPSSPNHDALLRALAIEFLIEFQASQNSVVDTTRHPQGRAVRELINWFKFAYSRPIRRSELAERAGMSESSLAAAFRAVTGHSPIDYLIEFRLAHARRLLQSSRERVGEIAAHVGIPDVYYFSKLFKRRHGISPLQYRQQRSI